MGDSDGANSSAAAMDPQISEDGDGQPAACSSGAALATKTATARSTTSGAADHPTEKVSVSSMLGEPRKSLKEKVIMRSASHKANGASSIQRRWEASKDLDTGEGNVGNETSEVILSEAECTSEWYKAIERRYCKTLIRELIQSEDGAALLLKTGKAGRTVLHVAAIQGSLELVDAIKSLPPGAVGKQTAHELESAIDGRCKLTADNIAVLILGYERNHYFKVSGGALVLEKFRGNFDRLIVVWRSNYELTRGDLKSLEETITTVWEEGFAKGRYKGLMESFLENVDYNFYSSRLFLFHHACSRVGGEEFIEDVTKSFGDERVKKLMELRDLQGRTPWHVAVAVTAVEVRDAVVKSLHESVASRYVDVRDGRGWTPLHVAATQPFSDYFHFFQWWRNGDIGLRNCPRSTMDSSYCTAFQLAVLHNNIAFIQGATYTFRRYREPLTRSMRMDKYNWTEYTWCAWTLALLLRNEDMFEILYDGGRFPEECIVPCGGIPPICLAAAMGNTRILRQFMNDPRFDPYEKDWSGNTSLHYAANGPMEVRWLDFLDLTSGEPRQAHTYVSVADVPNVAWLDARYGSSPEADTKIEKGFAGRKGCITMLLQAGVDMWQKNEHGRIADPGDNITDDEFINWWHEKIAKETLEMRNSLNQGGNAISVIGALIATASYVGPLQPPLNYGPDPSTSEITSYAHVWDLPVKIFMMSNSLSFYLAIASIMLAVVPSLPMPRESIWNELERTRKTVAWAICVLLLSVVGILVSYAAASIAVMPKHTSFANVRWISYPVVVGGVACLIGIVLFTIRVLRLMYPDRCRWVGSVWRNIRRYVWRKLGRKVGQGFVALTYNHPYG